MERKSIVSEGTTYLHVYTHAQLFLFELSTKKLYTNISPTRQTDSNVKTKTRVDIYIRSGFYIGAFKYYINIYKEPLKMELLFSTVMLKQI